MPMPHWYLVMAPSASEQINRRSSPSCGAAVHTCARPVGVMRSLDHSKAPSDVAYTIRPAGAHALTHIKQVGCENSTAAESIEVGPSCRSLLLWQQSCAALVAWAARANHCTARWLGKAA